MQREIRGALPCFDQPLQRRLEWSRAPAQHADDEDGSAGNGLTASAARGPRLWTGE
jgi:hypothetical protein